MLSRMGLFRKTRVEADIMWRECLECGNRYRPTRAGYHSNWCSARCQGASIQKQRLDIQTSWHARIRWLPR
jgi:hypothetical protein